MATGISAVNADYEVELVEDVSVISADQEWEIVGACSNDPLVTVEVVEGISAVNAALDIEIITGLSAIDADRTICITNAQKLEGKLLKKLYRFEYLQKNGL